MDMPCFFYQKAAVGGGIKWKGWDDGAVDDGSTMEAWQMGGDAVGVRA